MVAGVMACAMALTGCGGDSSSGETPKGGRKAFEGTTLRVLLKEGYEIEAIKQFLPDFESATGIKVEMEVYDEPTARQKLVLDATSKTGTYDVTSGSFWNMPEFVKAGWLEPLDDYIAKAPDEWLHVEDIPPGAKDSMTLDGKLYALPHTALGGLFYYRKDIFDELGLPAPETTEDILAAAAVIKEKRDDVVPFTSRGIGTFASLGSEVGWAYGYGALLFDEDNVPHADSPEMIDAMTDYVTMMKDYGPSDAATLDFTQAGEKFSSGSAAMMFDNSAFGTIFENPEQSKVAGKVGYTLPTGPDGGSLQWLYNEGLAITAGSKNKNAAWLFLQWRVSRETMMKELTEIGRTDVPNLFVLNSPEYAAYAKEHNVEEFTKMIPESLNEATAEHWPFYPEFAKIGDVFAQGVSSAIAGSESVEDAQKKTQEQLMTIMKDAGYIK